MRGDGDDDHFLNMLQVATTTTLQKHEIQTENLPTPLCHSKSFFLWLQAAMEAQRGPASAEDMLGHSALDLHSTTFIQSKDVDPSSTSENSQCRCPFFRAAFCNALNVFRCGRVLLAMTRASAQCLSVAFCER